METLTIADHLWSPLTYQWENRSYSSKNSRKLILSSVCIAILTAIIGGAIYFYCKSYSLKKRAIQQLKIRQEQQPVKTPVEEVNTISQKTLFPSHTPDASITPLSRPPVKLPE